MVLNLLEIELLRKGDNLGYNRVKAMVRRVYLVCGEDVGYDIILLEQLKNYDRCISILRSQTTRAQRIDNFTKLIKFIDILGLMLDKTPYEEVLEYEKSLYKERKQKC